MRKIVINRDFGGFGLSDEAFERLLFLKRISYDKVTNKSSIVNTHYYEAGHAGEDGHYLYVNEIIKNRDDVDLVAVVEEMGTAANGDYAELAIVEIPEDIEWVICEYDGIEHVAEKHKIWY